VACAYDKPIRIGVNWARSTQELLARTDGRERGPRPTLEPKPLLREALVRSAIESAERAEQLGLRASHLPVGESPAACSLIAVNTRAVGSAGLPAAISVLIPRGRHGSEGHRGVDRGTSGAAARKVIGDTIRVSLTPAPEESRTLRGSGGAGDLQTLGLRAFTPILVVACPAAGPHDQPRSSRNWPDSIQTWLREQMPVGGALSSPASSR